MLTRLWTLYVRWQDRGNNGKTQLFNLTIKTTVQQTFLALWCLLHIKMLKRVLQCICSKGIRLCLMACYLCNDKGEIILETMGSVLLFSGEWEDKKNWICHGFLSSFTWSRNVFHYQYKYHEVITYIQWNFTEVNVQDILRFYQILLSRILQYRRAYPLHSQGVSKRPSWLITRPSKRMDIMVGRMYLLITV